MDNQPIKRCDTIGEIYYYLGNTHAITFFSLASLTYKLKPPGEINILDLYSAKHHRRAVRREHLPQNMIVRRIETYAEAHATLPSPRRPGAKTCYNGIKL